MSPRVYNTRQMQPEDIGFFSCRYVPAYSQACGRPTSNADRICPAHRNTCSVCGTRATNECSYAGQFVCGTPLCDDCEGWEDMSKPSGSWGFMNHGHRRKPSAPPLRKMRAEDIGVSP